MQVPPIHFSLNPADLLTFGGAEAVIVSFIIFLLLGLIVRLSVKVALYLLIIVIVLWFAGNVQPSYSTVTSFLFNFFSAYIMPMATFLLALVPFSPLAAILGFAIGFFDIGLGINGPNT